jgi:H+/Cl- antiporter ClcA
MEQGKLTTGLAMTSRFVVAALVLGVALGAVTKGVFWMFTAVIDVIWDRIPDQLAIDSTGLVYMAGVLAIGGLLVGLGNKYLGYHPEALETVIGRVKTGGEIEHTTIPQTLLNSLASLGFGGPLGPEAALVATVGGLYYWAKNSLEDMAVSAYRSFTGGQEGRLLQVWRQVPAALTVVGIVLGFRLLPGGIDNSFVPTTTSLGMGSTVLLAAATGIVAGIVGVLTSRVGEWVRSFKSYESRPLVSGVLGGLAVAAIAVPSSLVLFSGAEEMSAIFDGSTGNGELLYSAGGKWVALIAVLFLGWKGGPIFPLMFVSGATAVAVANLGSIDLVVVYAAAVSASVAGALGSAVVGIAVALLVVPTSLILPMAVGAIAAGLVVRLTSGVRRP